MFVKGVNLRKYEELLLVKPELGQQEVDSLLNKVKESIVKNEGKVIQAKLWKRSKLAYEIKHYRKGIYLLILFEIDSKNLKSLKRFCELEPQILRFLVVRKSNEA